MQSLSDPPSARELAQFLDPDGMAWSFRLETKGGKTTAHPAGRLGPVTVWFLRSVCAVIVVGAGIGGAELWRVGHPVVGVVLFSGTMIILLAAYFSLMRLLRWLDRFSLIHGQFAHWNRADQTIELPRQGTTLKRDQLVGAVCLTGGEWCGGWVRSGAWCPLSEGLPDGAPRQGEGWVQLCELSVIARLADGKLARFPLMTVENPWRFREFAERFAASFGLPLRVIALNRSMRRELRREGWKHAGEFADADRPRKIAAGRVAVSDGGLPGFGRVRLCLPRPSEELTDRAGNPRSQDPPSV